ncbi:MerR family transcriptional regulator [Epibacterium sp. SM1969]|uniref:MerR family transcriptional regulator n=1 Tax=Tritonibacter aquimaris TaxID=2663379 RepID=A0A844AQY4_9RHOB|nr:helix-turn-helix domain-containing protein [Tritonibacter aquimaris]MQY41458.1 MerR family transcriptional regulator [Tritonibacter aquimaris]
MLDIGEVTERAGITASALRYYEKLGLIESCARNGLRRQYDHGVLERLAVISLGKAAGFSLDEISEIFGLNGKFDIPRHKVHARADALDAEILRLQALTKMMRHVADCPAEHQLECPKFRKLLRVAHKADKR